MQEEGELSFHFCNFCYLSSDDQLRPGKVIGGEKILLKSGSGPSRDLLVGEVKLWLPHPQGPVAFSPKVGTASCFPALPHPCCEPPPPVVKATRN